RSWRWPGGVSSLSRRRARHSRRGFHHQGARLVLAIVPNHSSARSAGRIQHVYAAPTSLVEPSLLPSAIVSPGVSWCLVLPMWFLPGQPGEEFTIGAGRTGAVF